MIKKSHGFFYNYRGNGYGPFRYKEDAENDYTKRLYNDNSWIGEMKKRNFNRENPRIFYGTAITDEKKRLIEFITKHSI